MADVHRGTSLFLHVLVVPLLGGFAAALPPAAAQESLVDPVPVLQAVRMSGQVEIDGVLDEPAWQATDPASGFTQTYPQAGAPSTQPTQVRVLYDDAHLYVGVRLHDTAPDSIAAPLARRGTYIEDSDWIHIVIDSRHDRRTAFRFSVNPRGVKQDAYLYEDTQESDAWDAVWEEATQVDAQGWTAEFRIPFSQLRFGGDAGRERTFGIQFVRDIARSGERSAWAPWTRADAGTVSRFGRLVGLHDLPDPRGLEIVPYVSGEVRTNPPDSDSPLTSRVESGARVGGDVRMGLPQGLTLSGTFNPDFGHVEADPAEVNLTVFETFFEERRPFFTEGMDSFRFGESRAHSRYGFEAFFHSRRIGRTPQRPLPGGEYLEVDAPTETRILGATKISGRAPNGWSVGVLNAVTDREHARVLDPDGVVRRERVEPLSNYFVGRLRRDLREGGSGVGVLFTATHRALGEELQPWFHNSAYLAGADVAHSSRDRRWSFSGHLAVSTVRGSPEAVGSTQRDPARFLQRPDSDRLAFDPEGTSLSGHLLDLSLVRSATWFGSVQLKQVSPGFEINDLGFQGRSDSRSIVTLVGRSEDRRIGPIRRHNLFASSFHAWNFDGDRILAGYLGQAEVTFLNLWEAGLGMTYRPEHRDDRLTRGGPLATQPAQSEFSGRIRSDPRAPLSFSISGRYQEDASGGNERQVQGSVDVRTSPASRVQISPTVTETRGTAQYVMTTEDARAEATYGARHVFADLEQTTAAVEVRAEWTFLPTVSFQFVLQPFVSVGTYSRFSEFAVPGGFVFDVYGFDRGALCRYGDVYAVDPVALQTCPERLPPVDDPAFTLRIPDPSFHVRSVRGTALLRWEFLPGSALFIVWQQERDGFDRPADFQFARDIGETFRDPAHNVLLLKASYWIGR